LDLKSRGSICWGVNMIEQIMSAYGIHPVDIDHVTRKVSRVTDGVIDFALKASTMTSTSLTNWQQVLHQANHSNLPGVLPVYLTIDNALYTVKGSHILYLMPWIEENNQEELNIELLFKYIGQIHQRTQFTTTIPGDKTKQQFKEYQNSNESDFQFLFNSVQQFEQNKYMSPFELLICSQFISLENVFNVLNSFVDRFMNARDETSLWNLSLCHGNLKREHLIQSSQLYIINWENAKYDNAIIDLTSIFSSIVNEPLIEPDPLIDQFEVYLQENELEIDELYLLVIFLLDCREYLSIIKNYLNRNPSHYSMINQIIKLQHTYRILMLGLKIAEHVETKENDSLLDDLDNLES